MSERVSDRTSKNGYESVSECDCVSDLPLTMCRSLLVVPQVSNPLTRSLAHSLTLMYMLYVVAQ